LFEHLVSHLGLEFHSHNIMGRYSASAVKLDSAIKSAQNNLSTDSLNLDNLAGARI